MLLVAFITWVTLVKGSFEQLQSLLLKRAALQFGEITVHPEAYLVSMAAHSSSQILTAAAWFTHPPILNKTRLVLNMSMPLAKKTQREETTLKLRYFPFLPPSYSSPCAREQSVH